MTSCTDARLRQMYTLTKIKGLGAVSIHALLDRFSLSQLFNGEADACLPSFAQSSHLKSQQRDLSAEFDSLLNQCVQRGIQIITLGDDAYPGLLTQIADPPPILFCLGDTSLLQRPQLAMVGSRRPSYAGRENARYFAKQLAQLGFTITSGMALGIDAESHIAALEQANSIAVLATGVDCCYPYRHKALYSRLIDGEGCVVSEQLPGTPVRAHNFPKRNRIITGMSLGVLVVEAAKESGSLISARLAAEQNREVFAVPGALGCPQSQGCHQLIKNGAKLTESAADIIQELEFWRGRPVQTIVHKKSTNQGLYQDQLLASVDFKTTAIDVVVERSKLPVEVVVARLIKMELRGLVKSVPGGYVKLRRD